MLDRNQFFLVLDGLFRAWTSHHINSDLEDALDDFKHFLDETPDIRSDTLLLVAAWTHEKRVGQR